MGEALALRGEEDGGFTTVDLLQIDLFSGKSAVYKLGAAPTYLRRGGVVERLCQRSSLPVVTPSLTSSTQSPASRDRGKASGADSSGRTAKTPCGCWRSSSGQGWPRRRP